MKRLSSKEYDDTLKIMRRWMDPYRSMVGKLVDHIKWQFSEIKRLEDKCKKLEQTHLLEKPSIHGHSVITYQPKPNEKWPLSRRLKFLRDKGDTRGFLTACKWNELTEEEANALIDKEQNTL